MPLSWSSPCRCCWHWCTGLRLRCARCRTLRSSCSCINVLLSAVLNGEPLFRWQYLAALVFVCVGIWLVNKAPAKKEGK